MRRAGGHRQRSERRHSEANAIVFKKTAACLVRLSQLHDLRVLLGEGPRGLGGAALRHGGGGGLAEVRCRVLLLKKLGKGEKNHERSCECVFVDGLSKHAALGLSCVLARARAVRECDLF